MIQFFSGLLMATVHVVTGPDHLAAVTPLAVESKSKAWHIGLFWGMGHVLGMLLIGLLYLVFRELIPVEKISGYSEYLVGIVLIGIGVWAIYKAVGKFHTHHSHPHYHPAPEPFVHIHRHGHDDEFYHSHQHQKADRQNSLTAISVGTLHGFAGISHFLLILPTLTLPSVFDSVIYLAGFAAGTILAMVSYAFFLGIAATKSSAMSENKIFKYLRIASGILAILVGIYWLIG